MNLRRLRAMFHKELRHIVRDVRSLLLALALPLLFLVLFGYALSLDVDRIPTFVYDADRSPESRDLIQRFAGSRYFQIAGFVDNYPAIERAIDANRILMGIVIPRDYSRRLRGAAEAGVQVLLDGSDSNTASIALGYAGAILRGYSFELRSEGQNRRGGTALVSPVDAQLRVWYNSSLQSKNYIVPGLIAVILMIIASMLTSLTIAREWEMGTMEQLLSTPVRPTEMVLGKMLAFFAVGLADMIIAVLVGIFLFDVPMRGSFLLLAATSCMFLFGALFWGIYVSAAARSQMLAFQLGLLTSFLPAMLLSGFIYAIENMPLPIRLITYLVPARYFVTILKGIFLKGVGLRVLWTEILFLGAFGAVIFFRTTQKMREKLA
jgi:ABC-2 type transport system permease protein